MPLRNIACAFALVVGVFCANAPAFAQNEAGMTLSELQSIVSSSGLSFSTDAENKTLIIQGPDGPFVATLSICNGARCEVMDLFTYVSAENISIQRINSWNLTRTFAKSYIDNDNDAVLEMYISLEGGLTAAAVAENLAIWRAAMRDWLEFISSGPGS
ncbi:MAG: YbjN domain-containing protein [Pseudomonadota bacterium]